MVVAARGVAKVAAVRAEGVRVVAAGSVAARAAEKAGVVAVVETVEEARVAAGSEAVAWVAAGWAEAAHLVLHASSLP